VEVLAYSPDVSAFLSIEQQVEFSTGIQCLKTVLRLANLHQIRTQYTTTQIDSEDVPTLGSDQNSYDQEFAP
jgi:hypothetical protein